MIGAVSEVGDAQAVMQWIQQNPYDAFPFAIAPGCQIRVGSECDLEPFYQNTVARAPVVATAVTCTSFSFWTPPGHFEGAGARITFLTFEQGRMVYLQQRATGADPDPPIGEVQLPVVGGIANMGNRIGSALTWAQMAQQIRLVLTHAEPPMYTT